MTAVADQHYVPVKAIPPPAGARGTLTLGRTACVAVGGAIWAVSAATETAGPTGPGLGMPLGTNDVGTGPGIVTDG
jgi:hypothetical protein